MGNVYTFKGGNFVKYFVPPEKAPSLRLKGNRMGAFSSSANRVARPSLVFPVVGWCEGVVYLSSLGRPIG